MQVKNFARIGDAHPVPNLIELQRHSYEVFLQEGVPADSREDRGLEALFRETFPIANAQETVRLEYNSYELGRPRYSPDECRQLRLTYGKPLRVRVTLVVEGKQAIKEDVYLGEIPIMIGGGEFIVNGAERVIVTQLHRSPGVDFLEEVQGDRRIYSCRIIPERGSWIEMEINRRDVLTVRIDQSGKLPASLVLRALDEEHSSNDAILRLFYSTEEIKFSEGTAASKLRDRVSADTITVNEGERTVVEAGERLTDELAHQLVTAGVRSLNVLVNVEDPLVLNTIGDDKTKNAPQALKELYARLRPGTPFSLEKARQIFRDKFFDPARYRLGLVGRFRINRKFGQKVGEDDMILRPEDYINAVRYLMQLRQNKGQVDDIDHLGNRRVRTIGELAMEEFRKGFLKMRRTVQDRMNLKDPDQLTPRTLINSKTISSAIEYFFGRSELSQVVDQTNPLSQIVHERRLSALGPGGLNRKRAGFEVRDVHISHYGRICPIETPEGTNIGLITSLGLFATVDHYGFLVTPYRVVKNGKISNEIRYLRADEEENKYFAPADAVKNAGDGGEVIARFNGDYLTCPLSKVDFVDVSPKQIVGLSAALIPFLEHSDANRALMGSNMQRQAVPLLRTEQALISTGLEADVARNSGMVVVAEEAGEVKFVQADRIVVGDREYPLRKFVGLNERTCLNQRPCVVPGQKVAKGEVIADGAATKDGELALGRNVLVAFMPWDGYNFEDAILINENLVKDDRFTSVHIDAFEVEVRETKLGREEFTRDIPNVSDRQLRNLDEGGIIRIGTYVVPGDILVGKVAPKSRSELTPEEKLLYAIFGKAGEDVRNDSLVVPSGVEGIVIGTQKFSARSTLSEEKQRELRDQQKAIEKEFDELLAKQFRGIIQALEEILEGPVVDGTTGQAFELTDEMSDREIVELQEQFDFDAVDFGPKRRQEKAEKIYAAYANRVDVLKDERDRQISRLRRGDELPSGVLEMVKVYVATKRKLSVGDKMAGRHGNKGVIAKILPEEDMPFLPDGRPVEIVLNPLGVPSRMNVGQILETHLGWAARTLGFRAITPIFDGASEAAIREALKSAGLPETGKTMLYDGRTGDLFSQRVTVGYMYMLKLNHLVDDKVHARATGPYSLITQQPLGGKARFGGQRLGEMEVWALEAYGAAHILQELVTVKSDDVDGRTKIYESIVKGENILEAGVPMAFEVLCNEVRGLCLNIRLEKQRF